MKKNQMEKFGIEIPRNVRPTRPHTGRYKQKQRMGRRNRKVNGRFEQSYSLRIQDS